MSHFSFDQRVENLFKSYFSTYSNINIELNEKKISVHIIDANNHDSASIDLIKFEDFHQITFFLSFGTNVTITSPVHHLSL